MANAVAEVACAPERQSAWVGVVKKNASMPTGHGFAPEFVRGPRPTRAAQSTSKPHLLQTEPFGLASNMSTGPYTLHICCT